MFNRLSVYSIQASFLLLETASRLVQPEYSVKVLNTENVILSMGDVDDDTNYDLEIIKNHPENSLLEKKLYEFHKYINLAKKSEGPKERHFRPWKHRTYTPKHPVQYSDAPYEVAVNGKELSTLERRERKHKKKKKKMKKREKKRGKIRVKHQGEQNKDTTGFPDVEDIEAEYDYMEKEYWNYLGKSQRNHVAYKYSDAGKPEESAKDVVLKIFDFKTPKNCTNVTGIGVQALECIVRNFREGVFDRYQAAYSLSVILLIWICIYLTIALPLWCCKGWCCCCCRCEFCFPTKRVTEVQKYMSQNPPGTLRKSNGQEVHYIPSIRETELYETIKRSIAEY